MKKYITMFIVGTVITGCNLGAHTPSSGVNLDHSLNIQNGLPVNDPVLNSMVPLIYIMNGDRSSICTGTVIEGNRVLTAAHCLLNMAPKKIINTIPRMI